MYIVRCAEKRVDCAYLFGRNRLRVNREIGRAKGSNFLWAVIDTDPRNADDLSAFQLPEFWYGQDRLPVAMSLPLLT